MSRYKMEIYMQSIGGVTGYDWSTEHEFRLVEAFLLDLLGPGGRAGRTPGQPDFYYVETEQQRQAFYDFLRTSRRSRRGSD